jgi:ACT domain-containing protein
MKNRVIPRRLPRNISRTTSHKYKEFYFNMERNMDDTEKLAIQRILADLRYISSEKAEKIRKILENA